MVVLQDEGLDDQLLVGNELLPDGLRGLDGRVGGFLRHRDYDMNWRHF